MNHSDSSPSTLQAIDALLDSFSRFGVDLSLDRILTLLSDLGNPHQQVPIIHVAGTNGKGSVCAYLSSMLTHAGYRVGRYTSPHLVTWTERICIHDQPIDPTNLLTLLTHIQQIVGSTTPSPTQFEVFTAAAWLYFAQQSVDIAVIEVGLGGRLDATNVCDRPLVSVITSISRDHWQRLGPTLADIAKEKAGILKAECPAVIGQLPPSAEAVVKAQIEALSCLVIWVPPAEEIAPGCAQLEALHFPGHNTAQTLTPLSSEEDLENDACLFPSITYPIPLSGQHQLMNSALAIATVLLLRNQGWHISDTAIHQGMTQTSWAGRIQWTSFQGQDILIDGAHNAAAAAVLRDYVDRSDRVSQSVHWVMGMLSTKDHADIFKALLREGDRLSLVPVPGHSSADPTELGAIAQQVGPTLENCQIHPDLFIALEYAVSSIRSVTTEESKACSSTIVLCGSLYLIGYFFKQQQLRG
ncbi:MAG: folylpolyglutamate synthase/dihydrofolate synthase family protein [Cyanobacteria bacterium P01_E01_bin.6]